MWGRLTEEISDGKIFRWKNIPVEKISAVKLLGLDNYQFFMYHLVYLLHSEKTKKHKHNDEDDSGNQLQGRCGEDDDINVFVVSACKVF